MEADQRKDIAARDEAFRHVSANSGFDPHVLSSAPLFQSPVVRAKSPLMQAAIAQQIFGADAANAITGSSTAMVRYCLKNGLVDADRRTICEHLVESTLKADQSTSGTGLAKAVGKRLGWSAARLQTLEDENDATYGLMAETTVNGNQYSCASLAKSNHMFSEMFAMGERSWAQQQMKASGQSAAEIAAIARPKLEALFEEAIKRMEAQSKK